MRQCYRYAEEAVGGQGEEAVAMGRGRLPGERGL